jgi:hypothetical protein
VGVLGGAHTEIFLAQRGIATSQIRPRLESILEDVAQGRLDAALLDTPRAAWALGSRGIVGVERVASCLPEKRQNAHIDVRREDQPPRCAIDHALATLLADGTIQAIFGEHGPPTGHPRWNSERQVRVARENRTGSPRAGRGAGGGLAVLGSRRVPHYTGAADERDHTGSASPHLAEPRRARRLPHRRRPRRARTR